MVCNITKANIFLFLVLQTLPTLISAKMKKKKKNFFSDFVSSDVDIFPE